MDNTVRYTTQKKAFAEELKRLKTDITANDRLDAIEQLNIKSRITLSQYLNGNVRSNDTAAQLILFFKKCISRRSLVLLNSDLIENNLNEMEAQHG